MDRDSVRSTRDLYNSKFNISNTGVARGLSFKSINGMDDPELQNNLLEIMSRPNPQQNLGMYNRVLEGRRNAYASEGNTSGAKQVEGMMGQVESLKLIVQTMHSTFGDLKGAGEEVKQVFRHLASAGAKEVSAFERNLEAVNKQMARGDLSKDDGLERVRKLSALSEAKTLADRGDFRGYGKLYEKNKEFFDKDAEFAGSDHEKRYQEWLKQQNEERRNRIRGAINPTIGAGVEAGKSYFHSGGDPLASMALNAVEKGLGVALSTYGSLNAGGGGIADNVADLAGDAAIASSVASVGSKAIPLGRLALGASLAGSAGSLISLSGDAGPEYIPPEWQSQANSSIRSAANEAGRGDEFNELHSRLSQDLPWYMGKGRDTERFKELTRDVGGSNVDAYLALGDRKGAEEAFIAQGGELEDLAESTREFRNVLDESSGSVMSFSGVLAGALGVVAGAETLSMLTGGKGGSASAALAAGAFTTLSTMYAGAANIGIQAADRYYDSSTLLSKDVYRGMGDNVGGYANTLRQNRLTEYGFGTMEIAQGMSTAGRGSFMGNAGNYGRLAEESGIAGRQMGVMLDEMMNSMNAYYQAGGEGGTSGYMGAVNALGAGRSGETNAFSKAMADAYVQASKQIAMTSTSSDMGGIMGMFAMTRQALMASDNSFLADLAERNPEMVQRTVGGLDQFVRSGLSGSNPYATGIALRSGLDYWDMSQGMQNGGNMSRIIGQLASETGMGRFLEGGNINRAGMNMVGMISQELGVDSGVLKEMFEAHYSGGLSATAAEQMLASGEVSAGEAGRDDAVEALREQRIESETSLVNVIKETIPTVTAFNYAMSAAAISTLQTVDQFGKPFHEMIANLLPEGEMRDNFWNMINEREAQINEEGAGTSGSNTIGSQGGATRAGNGKSTIQATDGQIALLVNGSVEVMRVKNGQMVPEDVEAA